MIVAILWVVLTVISEALFLSSAPFPLPLAAADEARIVDEAFHFLVILAIPVFTFVVATLLYSVTRFRHRGEPPEDGPAIHTYRPAVITWLLVTTGLTIFMIIHPGITGMTQLMAHAHRATDLVVQVEGSRFSWKVTYPQQNVTTFKELVLPVGKHVRFEVSATDVLHAFWVPAFRMKIDAVPGLPTTVYATANKAGTFEDDSGFRLQCAELCGVLHGNMTVPVRVLEQGEFDAWIAQQGRTN